MNHWWIVLLSRSYCNSIGMSTFWIPMHSILVLTPHYAYIIQLWIPPYECNRCNKIVYINHTVHNAANKSYVWWPLCPHVHLEATQGIGNLVALPVEVQGNVKRCPVFFFSLSFLSLRYQHHNVHTPTSNCLWEFSPYARHPFSFYLFFIINIIISYQMWQQ